MSSRVSLPDRLEQLRKSAPPRPAVALPPTTLFLPGLSEISRAMPNHIARSSLFAPVARGSKKMHKEMVLASRKDAVLTFWGEQLDETQADVWMQVMHEAIKAPLGDAVPINRARLLRAIDRGTGNYEYKWLHRTMKALNFAMLIVEVTKEGRPKLEIGRTEPFRLIDKFMYDPERESYIVRIDPIWRFLYRNREYALFDWEKRLRIRKGQDMAKALQRLVATSSESVQRFQLAWLKDHFQYFSPMRKFRTSLGAAMQELERVEVIAAGRIELSTKGVEQAVWTRL
jgi:hypothetical protein